MKRYFLSILAVVVLISVSAQAGLISVNCAEGSKDAPRDDQTVLATETAGYGPYVAGNWNNVQLDASGMALMDGTGAASGAVINFQVANGWGDNTADGTVAGANDKIARGYFDDTATSDGIGVDIEVTNVPYALYDVVLYLGTDASHTSYTPMTVGGMTQTAAPLEQFGTLGGWVLDKNVLVYSGLTGSILDIELPDRWIDGDGSARGSISGFQVVQVPEPCTIALLSLGGLALIRRRK